MAHRKAPRPPLIETLVAILPLADGMGGWERDPHGNNRGIMRPKKPLVITSAMCQVARDTLKNEERRRLQIMLQAPDDQGAEDAYLELTRHPGRFLADSFRSQKSISWAVLKAAVFERDQNRCRQCGGEGHEVDHIRERHLGGADCMENLILLCGFCHRLKPIEGWQGRSTLDVFAQIVKPALDAYLQRGEE